MHKIRTVSLLFYIGKDNVLLERHLEDSILPTDTYGLPGVAHKNDIMPREAIERKFLEDYNLCLRVNRGEKEKIERFYESNDSHDVLILKDGFNLGFSSVIYKGTESLYSHCQLDLAENQKVAPEIVSIDALDSLKLLSPKLEVLIMDNNPVVLNRPEVVNTRLLKLNLNNPYLML